MLELSASFLKIEMKLARDLFVQYKRQNVLKIKYFILLAARYKLHILESQFLEASVKLGHGRPSRICLIILVR